MYKNNRKFTRQYSSQRQNENRFRGNNFRGRTVKKVDPTLFVNKAKDQNIEEVVTSEFVFSDFAISDRLKRNIDIHGFTTPTPIQEQTIPHIIEGKDVIGIANTGTGKTAAFLIPLINKIELDKNQRVLIVTPTRELAKYRSLQIPKDDYLFINLMVQKVRRWQIICL